ncbi:MAG: hypothetical protein EOP10_06680 [Proteobacteria bacterium]|nr:MAG: hypothetical protein EOP10_06680 [Pseudomonadota bacterium]
MKLSMKNSLLFGLILSNSAHAADVVATQFKAIETDLARSELQLEIPYSMRVGFNFVEGHRFLLHPNARSTEDNSSIRRELDFSLMLPHRFEVGASLYDSQQAQSEEANALYGSVEHKKQNLGGALYARYHLVQSEGLRSSITLQYEPGTADRSSFHQASQDKTGLAFSVDGSPTDYLQLGAYLGMTRRQDEKFRSSRINDEVLYGMRVNAGPEQVKAFADIQIRSLPWRTLARGDTMQTGRHYEIGLAGSYKDLNIQLSKFIPQSEHYVGESERGFKISLQYVMGKKKTEAKEIEEVEKALEKDDKEEAVETDVNADAPAAAAPAPATEEKSEESLESLTTQVKDEAPGALPVIKDELPQSKPQELMPASVQSTGTDEFEKWDTEQSKQSQRAETPTERAEREYREQLTKDKVNALKNADEVKSAEQLEKERLLKEMEAEEKKALQSADEIEKELNQYTLPGADEVNWNGLGK